MFIEPVPKAGLQVNYHHRRHLCLDLFYGRSFGRLAANRILSRRRHAVKLTKFIKRINSTNGCERLHSQKFSTLPRWFCQMSS